MADMPLSLVLRQLRKMAAARRAVERTDSQLLECFIRDKDEDAFETLVRRHGRVVLGVCHRVLHDAHDAEDAFQATFLILVRKARSIGKRESLGSWLHGVAYRTAVRAKAESARRRVLERQAGLIGNGHNGHENGNSDAAWRDLRLVIDEELERLPEKYRTPVVLCYLEGRTNEEAARQLGWPKGTVSGRLARARDILRVRLTRRGITLSAGVLALTLTQHASASAPSALVFSTVHAATLFAAQTAAGLISAHVAALAEGVLKTMFLAKLKIAAAVLIAAGVVGTGGFLTYGKLAAQQQGTQPVAAAKGSAAPAPATPAQRLKEAQLQLDQLLAEAAKAQMDSELAAVRRQQIQARLDTLKKEIAVLQEQLAVLEKEAANKHLGVRLDTPDAAAADGWRELATLQGHVLSVSSLAFSPDGRTLVSVGSDIRDWRADKGIVFWDVETGKQVRQMPGHAGGVGQVTFSPDGQVLASGGADATVRLWDVRTGAEVRRFEANKEQVLRVAFTPDGKTLASAGSDNLVRLWDVPTGKERVRIAGHQQIVSTIAISPDGRILVSGSPDGTMRLFEMTTGKELRRFDLKHNVTAVAFSPDGKRIASAINDETVRLWDSETGKEVIRFRGAKQDWNIVGHPWVVFSPDGKYLAAAGTDGAVRLWEIATGKEIRLGGHQGGVSALAFSPDGKILATGGQDATIRLWRRGSAPAPARIEARGDDRFDQLVQALLKSGKTDAQLVEALCLATLSRLPTEGERKFMMDRLAKKKDQRREALEDIVWALTNSHEFGKNLDYLNTKDPRRIFRQ